MYKRQVYAYAFILEANKKELMDRLDRWVSPINILFFVLSGAELDVYKRQALLPSCSTSSSRRRGFSLGRARWVAK